METLSVIVRGLLILTGSLALESCGTSYQGAPSMDLYGSYFPAWLISLVVGTVLTAIVGALGALLHIRPAGFLRFLVAISMILIFSISFWFWLFAK